MKAVFSLILNMSLTGSAVIGAVLGIRLLLKRSPKIYSYILWSVVLFRLLCPVSLSAPVSLLNWLQPEVTATSQRMNTVSYVPYAAETDTEDPVTNAPVSGQPSAQEQPAKTDSAKPDVLLICSRVWMLGCCAMIIVGAVQYARLKKRLVVCTPLKRNVYLADDIDTPFVMGILRPRIYLPTTIRVEERRYILAHERHHIRRGDHVIKMLAYLALCIHWFNPLVWLAFACAGKDMEMSCDEAVIKQLGAGIRADYSATLLRMAKHRYPFAGTPLAFGEGDTKGRVLNMAKWKKPKLWASAICLLLCAVILVACAVNPDGTNSETFVGIVTAVPALNIREKPGPRSAAVGIYDNGTVVSILETKNGWGRTDQGWIHLDYVTPIDDIAAEETTEATVSLQTSFYDLSFTLPEGWQAQTDGEELTFTDGSQTFGGLFLQKGTGDVPERWANLGYMGSSSTCADEEYCMVEESPESSRDYIQDYRYYRDGNTYHLWLYYENTTIQERESLASTVTFEEEQAPSVTEDQPEKEASLTLCKNVLESVQRGSYHISTQRSSELDNGSLEYWQSGEDWMSYQRHTDIENIGAFLYKNGVYYDNLGPVVNNQIGMVNDDGTVRWKESTQQSVYIPWLATYQWNDDTVAYIDTLEQGAETVVMLRIDEQYKGRQYHEPHYFVNFYFTSDGTFIRAEITVDLYQNNEFTDVETLVTLDQATVSAEIDQEYQRAVG